MAGQTIAGVDAMNDEMDSFYVKYQDGCPNCGTVLHRLPPEANLYPHLAGDCNPQVHYDDGSHRHDEYGRVYACACGQNFIERGERDEHVAVRQAEAQREYDAANVLDEREEADESANRSNDAEAG
jgi:predicted RNA-binding Zn-ribbon protein involved in translation (DUF1610 family)